MTAPVNPKPRKSESLRVLGHTRKAALAHNNGGAIRAEVHTAETAF
jgi:hypothetical protein